MYNVTGQVYIIQIDTHVAKTILGRSVGPRNEKQITITKVYLQNNNTSFPNKPTNKRKASVRLAKPDDNNKYNT